MAKVLNGEVQAGDRVAYATRCGSRMTMNIGLVVEVAERELSYSDRKVPIFRVQVEQSSDSFASDRIRTLDQLDRVVKL